MTQAEGVKPRVLLTSDSVSIDAQRYVRRWAPHASDSWHGINYAYNRQKAVWGALPLFLHAAQRVGDVWWPPLAACGTAQPHSNQAAKEKQLGRG